MYVELCTIYMFSSEQQSKEDNHDNLNSIVNIAKAHRSTTGNWKWEKGGTRKSKETATGKDTRTAGTRTLEQDGCGRQHDSHFSPTDANLTNLIFI